MKITILFSFLAILLVLSTTTISPSTSNVQTVDEWKEFGLAQCLNKQQVFFHNSNIETYTVPQENVSIYLNITEINKVPLEVRSAAFQSSDYSKNNYTTILIDEKGEYSFFAQTNYLHAYFVFNKGGDKPETIQWASINGSFKLDFSETSTIDDLDWTPFSLQGCADYYLDIFYGEKEYEITTQVNITSISIPNAAFFTISHVYHNFEFTSKDLIIKEIGNYSLTHHGLSASFSLNYGGEYAYVEGLYKITLAEYSKPFISGFELIYFISALLVIQKYRKRKL